ncbi:MAG: hypothetical protein KGP28_09515 [Bdellovibrionales bacterium]|nr:hypothetical protein [Bdellovibrionales bacterium]
MSFYQVKSREKIVYWKRVSEPGIYSQLPDSDDSIPTKVATSHTVVNSGPDYIDGVIEEKDSSAVRQCAEQGLHLPTREEFHHLRTCLDPVNGPYVIQLSEDGIKGLHKMFPEMKEEHGTNWLFEKLIDNYVTPIFFGKVTMPRSFWTSSTRGPLEVDGGSAYLLMGHNGSIVREIRAFEAHVICVARP